MSIKEKASMIMHPAIKRFASKALRGLKSAPARTRGPLHDMHFSDLVAEYDVIIMKHCFPASDILEDTGMAEPSSMRQSLENYKTVYRQLRAKFDMHPDNLFVIWTLPPRHRLFTPSEGDKDENAARATAFSNWLKGQYLTEGVSHPNIRVWDFRGLVTEPDTNFLKYEYELSHQRPDSHPNRLANDTAGPEFAKFIVDSTIDFYDNRHNEKTIKILFLHHSTGRNVYQYPSQGLPAWFEKLNGSSGITYLI